jgi:hypothetical protein
MNFSIEHIQSVLGSFKYNDLGNGLIEIDSNWITNNLVNISLPAVGIVRCYKTLYPILQKSFKILQQKKLDKYITFESGGCCFCPRHTNWDRRLPLSSHVYGISVDMNVAYNPNNKISNFSLSFSRQNENTGQIITILENSGFIWFGENQSILAPKHFQFDLTKLVV